MEEVSHILVVCGGVSEGNAWYPYVCKNIRGQSHCYVWGGWCSVFLGVRRAVRGNMWMFPYFSYKNEIVKSYRYYVCGSQKSKSLP